MIWPEDTVMTDIPFKDSIMLNDQSVMESMSQTVCSTSIVDNDRLYLYRGHSQFPTDVFYLQQVVWLNYEECVLGSYYQCK